MKIKFYGGAREVGRSCIEITTNNKRFLLDAGIKLGEDITYPLSIPHLDKVKAVFISHAHLDHTGALPLFHYYGLNCPIFATSMTKSISRLLLKDSYKIQRLENQHVAYEKRDIKSIMYLFQNVKYNKSYSESKINFKFYDAGHIPGSASIKLNLEGKNLLYTGDVNEVSTNLLKGSNLNYGDIHTMIVESTYGDRNHTQRKQTEKDFLTEIEHAINEKKTVLIPAFGVGRTQEIVLMLAKLKLKVPIYLDGMGVKILRQFLSKPNYVKDGNKLRKAFKKCSPVKGFQHRRDIMHNQGIFVSTSGMVSGGPVMSYLKHFHNRNDVVILITGWQAPHTNGRLILENKKAYIDGWLTNVKCDVHRFDFSAHSGLFELQDMIVKVKPKNLIINHGDPKAIDYLASWAENYVENVFKPEIGSEIIIK